MGKSGFTTIARSKFLRSIFFQALSIFLILSIAIVGVVFNSFVTQMRADAIADSQRRLTLIENTITKRIGEIAGIAYNLSEDPNFLIEPVSDENVDYEMSRTLSHYLVGNDFIEHLAFFRLSEPDMIYTKNGKISFSGFFKAMGLDDASAKAIIAGISSCKAVDTRYLEFGKRGYFTYLYPLPKLSSNPKAFVLILVPDTEIVPLFKAQFAESAGKLTVFNARGDAIYTLNTLDTDIPLTADMNGETASDEILTEGGKTYVVQKRMSTQNGWVYASVIPLNVGLSGLNINQVWLIVLLAALLFVAVFFMIALVVRQYRPIGKLADTLGSGAQSGGSTGVVDERALLSDTIAALKDDSEQKQRFESAYYEADAANKAKSAFLSNMSHDIRTPMNAIIGMTAIAQKHADDPAYVRECLQKVQAASGYLLDILNNVLDMSRIESGKFTLSEGIVSLPALIHGLTTILYQSAEAKRQRLRLSADVRDETLIGDSVRLTQVFVNILSNAVKYTPEGGAIGMAIRQAETSEPGFGDYVFTFTDTGIGMSKEFLSHVFETFSRAEDGRGARAEGTGLGMAIVKSIVDLMGGEVACESELGVGTTITVSLRMPLAPGADRPADGAADRSDKPVLIVGDHAEACADQVKVFASLGAQAAYALSAARAAEMARKALSEGRPYRLIVINQTDADADGAVTYAALAKIASPDQTAYALAVVEPTDLERDAVRRSGVRAILQLPLFRSTVLPLLYGVRQAEERPELDAGVPDLTGKRILIAEDNAINREIAVKLIADTKAEITTATNGAEAVSAFLGHACGYFDLILMDIQMPVLDGYAATAKIRAADRPDARTTRIYAMTANTFDEDVRKVLDAGMNGHIGKPFTPDELNRTLREAMDARAD